MAACSGLLEVAVVCAKVGEKVAASESLVAVRPENHSRVISFPGAGLAAHHGALWHTAAVTRLSCAVRGTCRRPGRG
jgi:hypothetical protein